MVRFLVRLFAAIGLLALVLVVGGSIAAWRFMTAEEPTPERIVIEFDFDRALIEYVPRDPVAELLFGRQPALRDLVDALDRARMDPRVHGMVARFGGDRFGLAEAQELRAAVERFRDSGRFALAFADSFGEFGPANVAYYLASGFDEIWMQPVGMLGLTGISAEVPFAREALDKLEIDPEIAQREEYKTFANLFTETGFTPAHREMTESLVNELSDQLVGGVARGRNLTPEAVTAAIDRAPLLDREAVEAKFVDRLGYADEIREAALARAGAGAGYMDALDYLDAAGRPNVDGPKVALIFGVGGIERGESGVSPLLGQPSMGAQTIVHAFDEAIDDPAVRAILFRIDSPGGSAVGSESIRRAVHRARLAGKPVVVSMGASAASGGYWIAMGADRILAQPGTLTGSIGVVAGKMVTDGLWQELGISWESVARGRHATMWSALTVFSEEERERLAAMLDDLYGAFTARVAEGRDLPVPAVRDIAKGRVWTGSQAHALGLVDELGGLEEALASTRGLMGLEPGAPVRIDTYPRPADRFERLLAIATGSRVGETALATRLRSLTGHLEPMLRIMAAGHVLTAPDVRIGTR
ncbi:signal peptide peptidase SppA [Arenibaculum sp.]|uniref:signal peptide peptidase SppA n=1 Tax=Arenibaculum sp. TaxID=2865862 RepID=UPI002E0D80FD|nr:signal peptide peptidase SppA [Arenibaculum sp.]